MTTPTHKLSFIVGDEGRTWSWKVEVCPGPEHCRVFEETKCRCAGCDACAASEHWECANHEDENHGHVGPGCSIRLMTDACGLDDWLGNIGSEMIAGEAKVTVDATVKWEDPEYPVFELGGSA